MEAERLLQELHTKLMHEDTEQGAGAHLGGDETGDSDEHDDDGDGEHEQHFASFGQETYDKDDGQLYIAVDLECAWKMEAV